MGGERTTFARTSAPPSTSCFTSSKSPFCTASTAYELHPAGLAVLARYASGRNVASAPVNCTLPLLLKLPAGGEGGGVYLSPGDVATAGAATELQQPV